MCWLVKACCDLSAERTHDWLKGCGRGAVLPWIGECQQHSKICSAVLFPHLYLLHFCSVSQ